MSTGTTGARATGHAGKSTAAGPTWSATVAAPAAFWTAAWTTGRRTHIAATSALGIAPATWTITVVIVIALSPRRRARGAPRTGLQHEFGNIRRPDGTFDARRSGRWFGGRFPDRGVSRRLSGVSACPACG